jgi:hypothetical protein
MMPSRLRRSLLATALTSLTTLTADASVDLIAIGSISGHYEDLASQTADPLENGVAGNLLGGIGSGLAYAGGKTFLALPDRGPNAVSYDAAIDNTVSYIPRFHTFNLSLAPNPDYDSTKADSLPFVLTPTLRDTTLLYSTTRLTYATDGVPDLNKSKRSITYFTGRSDNFDTSKSSTNFNNARLDPEGIRVSNDGQSVFISDEYGPYLYQFDRASGRRLKSFKLPDELAVTNLSAQGQAEIDGNTSGRTANKGMEGLAITPDGRTLVGIIQANLLQDKKKSLRIVALDIRNGRTHEYAYQLTDGSGVSEILALNDHQFLVDERDGSGLGDNPEKPTAAKYKELFLIDLANAQDVSGLSGDLSGYAVAKTQFLDIVAKLKGVGIDSKLIPSKIEGMAFGPDVVRDGVTRHTLFISSDNDFLGTMADPSDPANKTIANPNLFYVFAFGDEDLGDFKPQEIRAGSTLECGLGH